MQNRMKTHPLSDEQIQALLTHEATGSLATIGKDGFPYITPMHFVYMDNAIFMHGLPKGQKIDNIRANSKVGFTVYKMDSLLLDKDNRPCDTNTKYESVIIEGITNFISDMEDKRIILSEIVGKYTPHLINQPLPDNMVQGTVVLKISINQITGKFYN